MANSFNYPLTPRRFLVLAYLLGALWAGLFITTPTHAQSIDDGLAGYWPFDTDNPTADLSGNGNTVTLGSRSPFSTDAEITHTGMRLRCG